MIHCFYTFTSTFIPIFILDSFHKIISLDYKYYESLKKVNWIVKNKNDRIIG